MAFGFFWSLVCLVVLLVVLYVDKMGLFSRSNRFPVNGRTVLITGGSTGMGREVARQLAEKGANVIVSARTEKNLVEAVNYIKAGAKDTQHISYVAGDVSDPAFPAQLMAEATRRNDGQPPDIVWCCAGIAYPTLFMDTPTEMFKKMMDVNYFGAVYTAQAALTAWLPKAIDGSTIRRAQEPRHLIFTTSLVALVTIPGYTQYSPTKAATKSLADTLAMELVLYESKYTPIKVHTCFPATILSAAYEDEQRVKSDLVKKLEEADDGQTPEVVARESIAGLEAGDQYVTTALITRLLKASVLGVSARSGWGVVDTLLSFVASLAMPFVRRDYEGKVRSWGKQHGISGAKS